MIIETNSERDFGIWDLVWVKKPVQDRCIYIGGRSGCREDDIYQRVLPKDWG